MPDVPIAKNQGPEGPAPGTQDNPAPAPGAGKRWWRKPVVRPIVLFALGLVLLPRELGQPRAVLAHAPQPGPRGMSRCESNRPPVWIRCGPRLTESSWKACISGRG